MGTLREPKPVKLFIAFLADHETLFPAAEKDLGAIWGAIDLATRTFPWAMTDYYKAEMGSGLLRKFVSFDALISPERLPEIKLMTQGLEEGHRWVEGDKRGRRLNADPGYLEAAKVVLASTKNTSHRIYLRSGIYGEVALRFYNGSFQPSSYTYPDYCWPETLSFFAAARSLYLSQLRQHGGGGRESRP